MKRKKQLERIAERLKYAISIFDYEYEVEIDEGSGCITLVFSSDTDNLTSSLVGRFSHVVGDAGVSLYDGHLELYGFPILIP